MRRTRIAWFAMGAAMVSLSWLLSNVFLSHPAVIHPPRLLIGAPDMFVDNAAEDELANLRLAVGEKLRNCGAASFEIEMSSHGFIYELPIVPENESSVACLIEQFGSPDDNISLYVETSNS